MEPKVGVLMKGTTPHLWVVWVEDETYQAPSVLPQITTAVNTMHADRFPAIPASHCRWLVVQKRHVSDPEVVFWVTFDVEHGTHHANPRLTVLSEGLFYDEQNRPQSWHDVVDIPN